jgi:hypothetical protein
MEPVVEEISLELAVLAKVKLDYESESYSTLTHTVQLRARGMKEHDVVEPQTVGRCHCAKEPIGISWQRLAVARH